MVFVDIVIALATAVALAIVLVPVLGWRPSGSSVTGWSALAVILPVFLLVAWVANLVIRPLGPGVFERQWVPGVFAAGLISLVLVAVIPLSHGRRPAAERHHPRGAVDDREGSQAAVEAGLASVGLTVGFIVLMIMLALAVAAAYLWSTDVVAVT